MISPKVFKLQMYKKS